MPWSELERSCFFPSRMKVSEGHGEFRERVLTETLRNKGERMPMNKFITAGIAGHVDHGKKNLFRYLTGIDPERPTADERWGILEPSIPALQLASGSCIALVDVPDRGDFLKNTNRGLNSLDLAILVVAADEGVMPQTKDDLEVLRLLKAQGGFVVLGKADVVDAETLELAEMEVREVVEGSFLQGKPVIPFSDSDCQGPGQILATMEEEADRVAGPGYFATAHYKSLKKKLINVVTELLAREAFKMAVTADEIRRGLGSTVDDLVFGQMLRDLCKEGKLVRTEAKFRVPSLSVKLPSNREKTAQQMLEYAANLGYVTFSPRTFCELHWKTFDMGEIHKVLGYLRNQKKLVRLNDGRYVTFRAMEEIKEKVKEAILQKGSLTVQDSKEILGYGRNRGVPVLEYLDSIGLTCRMDDVRVLK
jgi:hypothetical protein